MNLRQLFLAMLVLLVAVAAPAAAGENPFSGTQVTADNTGSDEAATPTLPAVKDGQRVQGTVDVVTSLNIRSGPWGEVVGAFGPGDKITIVGQLGDWYKIEFNGKTAFVHSAWVKREGEAAKAQPRSGWVNAATGLNVRRVPGGDIIGALKDQQSVEILGSNKDYYKIKYGDNEAFVSRKYIDTDQPKAPVATGDKTDFVGYVNAGIGLNVRTAPWGAIDTALPYGIAVHVTGKVNDWYKIDYNGKERYIHADYITKNRSDVTSSSSSTTSSTSTSAAAGSLQQRVAQEARKLVGSTAFRTADVDYGNLACAKVVTTALKNAGALDRVSLNCRESVNMLHEKGWKDVSAPPYREGDVILWKTYDYTGDGVKDPDTHIGVIVKEGNSYMAMNNSSRLRTPRMTEPSAIGPVTRVLRKD